MTSFLRVVVTCMVLAGLAPAERLSIKRYTTADGLLRDGVLRIRRDSSGFLWFCTAEGISRFNGAAFTNYGPASGLPSASVNDLLETSAADYWIATGGAGIYRFRPGRRVSGLRFEHDALGGDADFVYRLLEDHLHRVWIATDGGVFRIDNGKRPERVAPSVLRGGYSALVEDRHSGALWFGSTDHGLFRLAPDGRITAFSMQGELANRIHVLWQDRDGTIFAGTSAGLYCFAPEADPTKSARHYTTADGLGHPEVKDVLRAQDGRLWVATLGGGVSVGEPGETGRFRTFGTANGLPQDRLTSLAEDTAGALWIATATGGVARLARSGFTTFDEHDGLPLRPVFSTFEDRGGHVIALTRPLHALELHPFEDGRFVTVRPGFPASLDYFGWGYRSVALQDSTGKWWIGTGRGLYVFPEAPVRGLAGVRPERVLTRRDGLASDDIFELFEDSRGDIWISTVGPPHDGLARRRRATGRIEELATDRVGGVEGAPTAFGEDASGAVWIGYPNGALYVKDGVLRRVESPTLARSGTITGFYVDRLRRLWIAASRAGLLRIDEPGPAPRVIAYTEANGVGSSHVTAVTGDAAGSIYFAHSRGIDRLDPASGRIQHFTTADGLVNAYVISLRADRLGDIWVGTWGGLSRLRPEAFPRATPPPARIYSLRVGGVEQPLADLGERRIAGLELKPGDNQIEIGFGALAFADPDGLRYQWMLEPVGAGWSAPAAERTIHYAHLSPGRYRFRVRAVNAFETAHSEAEISFRIMPPVWQRWWFLILTSLATAGLMYALYRYRVAQILRLERVRSRIAADLHDDIGSNLSHISLLTEVARRSLSDRSTAEETIARISSVAGEAVDSMSDIVWAVRPSRDRLDDLVHRMRRFANDVLEAAGIAFVFEVSGGAPDARIEGDIRRQVFLIFKESIRNVVRHAQATSVEIRLTVSGASIRLEVRDNGTGFDGAGQGSGFGLGNIRARVQRIGGRVEIRSSPGCGSSVSLQVTLDGRRQL